MPRRNTIKKLLTIVTLVLLTGCVNQDIIVDKRGLDEEKYRQDLAECQDYAHQIDTGAEAAQQGVIGAAVGGVIGAIIGDGRAAQKVAGAGAVSGATKGASHAERRKDEIVYNCLRGRGYKVLG
ncbi:MAG TPA: hypothetical protein QF517_01400 [Pseudomonadales bacterium]|jgi:uncharacterized protein YcfJ|nr:glycine zipper family protein [Gammaproteobacteria bacterium]MDP6027341.1 hypothetical protein [Pseudomonadales bacterium]MBP17937.1 glycine zipper family protein [Gammaproteobacteria bacterium]MDP6317024.1 hypothetical protein [Pseudomonadales bacterium]MDP7316199.1 hypothetical protein [Pseudomonadales bacterium]|tara:strand:- start:8837 stop:9208 length:372 start_codon:yes stop_codon:yes gene_type:complete